MSKGLFHRAIAISGSPITPDYLPIEQKNLAIKQAILLNCSTNNIDEMFKCLGNKPAIDFGKSVPKFAVGLFLTSSAMVKVYLTFFYIGMAR